MLKYSLYKKKNLCTYVKKSFNFGDRNPMKPFTIKNRMSITKILVSQLFKCLTQNYISFCLQNIAVFAIHQSSISCKALFIKLKGNEIQWLTFRVLLENCSIESGLNLDKLATKKYNSQEAWINKILYEYKTKLLCLQAIKLNTLKLNLVLNPGAKVLQQPTSAQLPGRETTYDTKLLTIRTIFTMLP